MRRTWPTTLALFAVAVLTVFTVLAGSAAPAPSAAQAFLPRPNATTGTFPVSVQSADGTVRIPSRPDRVLCLSPSATQMLYAIGAGTQLVGVDMYSTYPPGAPRTKFTGYETSAEDYLPFRPDLVVLAAQTGTLVQQLQVLHIPVLLLPPATTFADVDHQLAELGTATAHQSAADNVQASLRQDVGAAARKAGNAGRGKTYYVEVDPTFYTATSKTFIGAEFSLFGMRDIADAAGHGTAYPQISPEYILKENPDYVFLADTVCCKQDATTFAHRPGFGGLTAVRLQHVISVNDSVASQWGPHTIEELVSLLATVLRS